MKQKLVPLFVLLALAASSQAQQAPQRIFPGVFSINPANVTHGQEFASRRWAIDATGGQQTITPGGQSVTYDLAATPTPYGNWSVGGPVQGLSNMLNHAITGIGNLLNVVDESGNPITLVNGQSYRFEFAVKPTVFTYDNATWTYSPGGVLNWVFDYGTNTFEDSMAVTLDPYSWKSVFYDFTYQSGNNTLAIANFDSTLTGMTRLSGPEGLTPTNLIAPTFQIAGVSPVPEPSSTLLGVLGALFLLRRRRAS